MLNSNEVLELLGNSPQGYLIPDHSLFTSSNSKLLESYEKLGAINSIKNECVNDIPNASKHQILCNVFSCITVFDNISSYQSHYNAMHRFICAECKKSFPTDHFLDLHISEHHDSYFMARIERGERLFKCYLEECGELFENSPERKEHCIEQHKFPSNFRFDQLVHTNSRRKDMTSKKLKTVGMELEEEKKANLKNPELKFFSFGHQKEKTFHLKNGSRQKRDNGRALEDMNTLKQLLELL